MTPCHPAVTEPFFPASKTQKQQGLSMRQTECSSSKHHGHKTPSSMSVVQNVDWTWLFLPDINTNNFALHSLLPTQTDTGQVSLPPVCFGAKKHLYFRPRRQATCTSHSRPSRHATGHAQPALHILCRESPDLPPCKKTTQGRRAAL